MRLQGGGRGGFSDVGSGVGGGRWSAPEVNLEGLVSGWKWDHMFVSKLPALATWRSRAAKTARLRFGVNN